MSSPPSLRPQLAPRPKPPEKRQDSRSSSYRDHNAGPGYESMPGDGASSGAQLLGVGKERVGQFPPRELQPFPRNLSSRTTLCPTVVEVAHVGVVEIRHGLGHGAGGPGPEPQPPARPPPPAASPTPAVRAAQARSLPLRKGDLGPASQDTSGHAPHGCPAPYGSSAPCFAVLVRILRLETPRLGGDPWHYS